LRQPPFLKVCGALRGDRLVQVLPHTRERLLPLLGFLAQAVAVRPRQALQEALIERVAVAGDARHELRERDVRVVVVRPGPAHTRTHEDGAGQYRRRLEQPLLAVGEGVRFARLRVHPGEQRVERHLAEDEAAVEPAAVDRLRIPLAEQHVRPLVHRVEVVVRPRVERELVELLRVEAGLFQQHGFGLGEQVDGGAHDVRVFARRDARPLQEQRDGADLLVRVVVGVRAGFQHRDGAVADVVVQVRDRAADEALGLVPRAALLQHRLARPRQEEGVEQVGVGLVGQKVGVVRAVRGGHFHECGVDDGAGLTRVLERGRPTRFQFGQAVREPTGERAPRRQVAARFQNGDGVGQPLLEAGVGPAVGEVQVSEQLGRFGVAREFVVDAVHPRAVPFRAGAYPGLPISIKQPRPDTKPTMPTNPFAARGVATWAGKSQRRKRRTPTEVLCQTRFDWWCW
jgi:hypothetical protein